LFTCNATEGADGLSSIARLRLPVAAGLLLALSLILAACGGSNSGSQGGSGGGENVTGEIAAEGSSTVQPITQAAAEAFGQEYPDVRITVGGAGTGDGFEAFCAGETQISDASRPIEAEEQQACADKGIEYIEIPVAYDGISVVVNSQNDFASDITSQELKTLWEPQAEGKVTTWQDVRSEWPDQQINLYGPGTESGTFDYFTEKINGEEGASRTDYQASENDNVLVRGVSGDKDALGYFGFSYYENNRDTLKALAVDGVEPSVDSIRSAEYPLSRPLFIYVNAKDAQNNKAVQEFVDFYLSSQNLDQLVEAAKYVTLPSGIEEASRQQWEDRTTGTIFDENGQPKGGDLQTALQQSQ
jgi:phosphate transport system substrate-binding protein